MSRFVPASVAASVRRVTSWFATCVRAANPGPCCATTRRGFRVEEHGCTIATSVALELNSEGRFVERSEQVVTYVCQRWQHTKTAMVPGM